MEKRGRNGRDRGEFILKAMSFSQKFRDRAFVEKNKIIN